jgi:diadenosine tetraphosphate (Ap4A) HIT family hydrolase
MRKVLQDRHPRFDPRGVTCVLCDRIVHLEQAGDPYLVAELGTGWVTLAENQYFEGTTEFLSKVCVSELYLLPPGIRGEFLREMTLVAEALARCFGPRKLNYELLGNTVPHLNWRLFPRPEFDRLPERPVWENDEFQLTLSTGDATPTPERREAMKAALRHALDQLHAPVALVAAAPPPERVPEPVEPEAVAPPLEEAALAVAGPIRWGAPAPRPRRLRRR